MIGWMMPRSRSDAASSSMSALENMRRGLRAFGCNELVGSRRWPRGRSTELSAPTSPISAASPRPNRDRVASSAIAVFPGLSVTRCIRDVATLSTSRHRPRLDAQLFSALYDLGREPQIGFAAAALEIIDQDRLAVGRRFRHAHIARDHRVVDLAPH